MLRQIFDVIADIDFCEYFPVNDISGFDRLASNMDGNEKIACVKVAFADKKWHYPWGDDRPTAEFFSTMIDTSDEDRSTMKVDYIGDAGHLGVTEITNLIIAIDESGRSAGLTRTFAAQEAPLVPIDWLPNQMNDPIEMGRYINQLTDSIVAMSKKGDMRKCMKRCAALSRVIFAKDITNEIMDLVKKSSTYHSHKLQELEKISVMLKLLKDGRSIRLNTLISTQVKELEVTLSKRGGIPDESVRKQFDDEARGIADRLLRYVRFGDDRRAA